MLLNGRTLQGKKAAYASYFVTLRYVLILLAAITLDIVRDENEDEDRIRNCTRLNYYALNKVADLLHLEFDKTRGAKRIYTELVDNGYVKIERMDGKEYICLTEKGKENCERKIDETQKLIRYFKSIPLLQDKYTEGQDQIKTVTKGSIPIVDSNEERSVEQLIRKISDWEVAGDAAPKKKALIISVTDYNATNDVDNLSFCKNDGEEMYEVLKNLGYEILDDHKLIGYVKYDVMRKAIYDFFDDSKIRYDDNLVFYYSGHGFYYPGHDTLPSDVCLASSEINPDRPSEYGILYHEISGLSRAQSCSAKGVVTILDCCHSGAAHLSKGDANEAVKMVHDVLEKQPPQGEGRCILAASQGYEEAYTLKQEEHSIFTYYLLKGLRENEKSVDAEGNVTASSLGSYASRTILNLPAKKRPKQKPITKLEVSGDIILASYPDLAKHTSTSAVTSPITQPAQSKSESRTERKKQQSWTSPKILVPVVIGVIVIVLIAIASILGFSFFGGNSVPIADAGPDQAVNSSNRFILDGSESKDSDGKIRSYSWKQIAGPRVVVLGDGNNTANPNPIFIAPTVLSDTVLGFALTVTDNKGATSQPDVVDITVKPVTPAHVTNYPPLAINQSVFTSINKPVNIAFQGRDKDNDNLTAAVVMIPQHGTLSAINQDTGFVTYTPNQGFIGNDKFAFKVNDGKKDSNNTGTISITVGNIQP